MITRGKRPQEFRRIYVSFSTSYRWEQNDQATTVGVTVLQQDVSGPLAVQPGQRLELPLHLVLPPDTRSRTAGARR